MEEKTYAQIWDETAPLELPQLAGQPRRYLHGSRGLSKMIMFADKVGLDNKIVDELMALNPREEGEDMKLVSRFQKALLRYRHRIYKFPNKIRNTQNESTRDNISSSEAEEQAN